MLVERLRYKKRKESRGTLFILVCTWVLRFVLGGNLQRTVVEGIGNGLPAQF